MTIEVIALSGTIVGALATIIGGLMAALSRKKDKHDYSDSIHIDKRLREASDKLTESERYVSFNQRANNMMIFGQYIVGGVLASSFLQESLSPSIVGALGLIVLISSTAQQHYKPSQRVVAGKKRCSVLKAIIREVEDDLEELRQTNRGIESTKLRILEQPLAKRISDELSNIETLEIEEFESFTVKQSKRK